MNYLIFNSGDYLGRILAGMIEWVYKWYELQKLWRKQGYFIIAFFWQPHNKPILVAVLSLLRVIFVPALLLCNARPRHFFPVMIHADYLFIILMGLFSFSNGYLANIALIWAPKYAFKLFFWVILNYFKLKIVGQFTIVKRKWHRLWWRLFLALV